MYSEIAVSGSEDDRLSDLEAQPPRLFEEIHAFIHDTLAAQCDMAYLYPLITHIENLEEMLAHTLTQHRMTQEQVAEVKNQLLILLRLIQDQINDVDVSSDHPTLEREFRSHQLQFLSSVGQQQTILQRTFGLTTLASEAWCERAGNIVLRIYVGLAVIAGISILTLMINQGRNRTITDVFAWAFIVTVIPLEIPIGLLFATFVLCNLCGPCIDYYQARIPENPNTIEGRAITTSLFGLFAQHKPHTLEDFRNNPNLPVKNIRDIALKLWLAYLTSTELLSSDDIQPVLEEYAHYLEARNRSFDQEVEGNFVNRLVTFYVEPGRLQLKSAIVSTDEVSQATTVLEAIAAVKKGHTIHLLTNAIR